MKGTEHTETTDTGKNNSPEIYFGSNYISERTKSSTENRRHKKLQKPTLPQRDRRNVHTMERNPETCTQWKTKNRSKQKNGIRLRE